MSFSSSYPKLPYFLYSFNLFILGFSYIGYVRLKYRKRSPNEKTEIIRSRFPDPATTRNLCCDNFKKALYSFIFLICSIFIKCMSKKSMEPDRTLNEHSKFFEPHIPITFSKFCVCQYCINNCVNCPIEARIRSSLQCIILQRIVAFSYSSNAFWSIIKKAISQNTFRFVAFLNIPQSVISVFENAKSRISLCGYIYEPITRCGRFFSVTYTLCSFNSFTNITQDNICSPTSSLKH